MKLKFKNTTLSPRAIVYKRYTDIQKAYSLNVVYKTIDGKFWVFNADIETFEPSEFVGATVVEVGENTVLGYNSKRFSYNTVNGWGNTTNSSTLSAKYGNIGSYQLNQYFLHGTFSYIKKSSEDETITRVMKGAFSPLYSLDIQYYDDYINLSIDDLIILDNRLFKIESLASDHKHQPKDFIIYSATITSIL
jgi:hypothetical protein